jgi:hypothetical protein
MYVASPPRVHPLRLYSTTSYPSSFGASAPSANHVSCIHNMSIFSYSNISSSFR